MKMSLGEKKAAISRRRNKYETKEEKSSRNRHITNGTNTYIYCVYTHKLRGGN